MLRILPYRNGDAGVSDTIDMMIDYAREYRADSRVRQIINSLKSPNEAKFLRNIHDYIVAKIEYQHDPDDAEVVASVNYTLFGNRPYGDCDDLATAEATLLLCAGYRVKFATIAINGSRDFGHVYLIVFIPSIGAWIPFDPTKGRAGFGWQYKPVVRRKYWRELA
jgi:transglutaminase-like putative cysteine protease